MMFLPCAALQGYRKFPNLHDPENSSEAAENFCGKRCEQPT